jgi:hypothetical protein
MIDFSIVQGELLPPWEAQLFGPDGLPLDIRGGATIALRFALMDGTSVATLTRQCTIVDGFVGMIRADWQSGDTAAAGLYEARFEVTFLSGSKLSVPARWPYVLEITPRVP